MADFLAVAQLRPARRREQIEEDRRVLQQRIFGTATDGKDEGVIEVEQEVLDQEDRTQHGARQRGDSCAQEAGVDRDPDLEPGIAKEK